MTHTSTGQEREEFEALITSKWPSVIPLWQESKGNYFDDKVRKLWWLWQAARRAPVVLNMNEPVDLTDTDVARIYREHSGASRFDTYTREFAQKIADFRDDQWRLANHVSAKR